jgi:hypothetical protein
VKRLKSGGSTRFKYINCLSQIDSLTYSTHHHKASEKFPSLYKAIARSRPKETSTYAAVDYYYEKCILRHRQTRRDRPFRAACICDNGKSANRSAHGNGDSPSVTANRSNDSGIMQAARIANSLVYGLRTSPRAP